MTQYLFGLNRLDGVTHEQLIDPVFMAALNRAVEYAVEQWSFEQIKRGSASTDIRPGDLIVRLDGKEVHILHRLNPFVRMKESMEVWTNIVNEELEMFGII